MKKTTNKLEDLQSKYNQPKFIKSYSLLKNLNVSPIQKEYLELVLSFQFNGREFFMQYDVIAEILDIETQSVTNFITKLKKRKYIQTQTKRFGPSKGSRTYVLVDIDFIVEEIERALLTKPNKKVIEEDLQSEIVQEKSPSDVTEPIEEQSSMRQQIEKIIGHKIEEEPKEIIKKEPTPVTTMWGNLDNIL